jgi:hypothetical protein
MSLRPRHSASVAASLGTLVLALAAPAAHAGSTAVGVPVASFPPSEAGAAPYPDASPGAQGALTALYVDSTGAAHVAYVAPGRMDVEECTIPRGASACTDPTTLHTDEDLFNEGGIDSIRYLPNENGGADLVVGMYNLGSGEDPHPPFNPGGEAPWSETEVFAPGATTGLATGEVFDQGGDDGGGEILEPGGSGVDVVGANQLTTFLGTGIGGVNEYQFQSLASGGGAGNSAPSALGTTAPTETAPGESLFEVTKLPQGQTAVLAQDISVGSPTGPDGMYVQPPSGGAFGPLQQLGIAGPLETDFAPGASDLINVETAPQYHPRSFTDTIGATMALYEFRATALKSLGTIGFAADLNDNDTASWDTLPPSFEDSVGNLYVAWLTRDGFDGCPIPSHDQGDNLYDVSCVMYRRIGPGGIFGPKVVLSVQGAQESDLTSPEDIASLGAIAANTAGEGWLLDFRDVSSANNEIKLFAQPLASSGGVTGAPAVSGSSVRFPVACAGGAGETCQLAAELQAVGATASAARATRRSHHSSRPLVLGSTRLRLAGGGKATLLLRLNKNGKRLLARRHHLKVTLVVSQTVGAVSTATPILTSTLTLR